MGEEFEDRDLSESVFWGVNLQRSMFRDADLSGTRFFHTLWNDVSIDGVVQRLVVNGVDVTDYVHQHDRWYPLRNELEPATEDGLRSSWSTLRAEWANLLARVDAIGGDAATRSVNGEWSVSDTLRHLVFAMDKWFSWPILGARAFAAVGLPNTGSQDRDWPGLQRGATSSFGDARSLWEQRCDEFDRYISTVDFAALPAEVEVLENGNVPAVMCFHVVLEETFEHLRYVLRDLDAVRGG